MDVVANLDKIYYWPEIGLAKLRAAGSNRLYKDVPELLDAVWRDAARPGVSLLLW